MPLPPPTSGRQPTNDPNRGLRIQASELFAARVAQAEVARRLEVSRQTVSRWHKTWASAGPDAFVAGARRGPRRRLSEADLARIGEALRQGPRAHGFSDVRWTCRQVALVIFRLTGVSYHPSHVCRLIHRMNWPMSPE